MIMGREEKCVLMCAMMSDTTGPECSGHGAKSHYIQLSLLSIAQSDRCNINCPSTGSWPLGRRAEERWISLLTLESLGILLAEDPREVTSGNTCFVFPQ